MRDDQKGRMAWILWQMLLDLSDHLWNHYEDTFLDLETEKELKSQAKRGDFIDAFEALFWEAMDKEIQDPCPGPQDDTAANPP